MLPPPLPPPPIKQPAPAPLTRPLAKRGHGEVAGLGHPDVHLGTAASLGGAVLAPGHGHVGRDMRVGAHVFTCVGM